MQWFQIGDELASQSKLESRRVGQKGGKVDDSKQDDCRDKQLEFEGELDFVLRVD